MTGIANELSNGIAQLTYEFTGRGSSRTRTYIHDGLVVCVLHDSLTKGEQKLLAAGCDQEVLGIRRAFQEAMRTEMIEIVERLTGRKVLAFMSANSIRPDVAIESFTLELNGPHDEDRS